MIDRERALVLHVCAHRGDGGLVLSDDGRPLHVDPQEVAGAIERARHRSRCAILNFCASSEIAPRLVRLIPAVISWPESVEDDQAACFSNQLYRMITNGARIADAVSESARLVANRWPELAPPALQGAWRDPVL